MDSERFIDRVATMHASWVERRYLRHIAADHTFEPQFELLRRLHEWAIGAVTDMCEVFGGGLLVEVYPSAPGELDRGVRVVVGGSYSLGFSLIESYDPRQPHWRVTAAARLPGGANDVAVKPHRQVGMWTRREFEDALLTLLAAYERDRSE